MASEARTVRVHSAVCVTAAALLALTSGCASEASSPAVNVTDSAGIRIVTHLTLEATPTWSLSQVPRLDLGTRDAEGPEQFFRVADATILRDGRLAVANSGSQEIRIFDASGAHVMSLGGEGEGPGEFRVISRLAQIAGDSLIVWDARQRRFTMYEVGGALGRTFTIQYEALNPLLTAFRPDGGAILGGPWFDFGDRPGPEPTPVYARYSHMGPTGELVDTLPRQLFGHYSAMGGLLGAALFAPRLFSAGHTEGYWVGTGQREELVRLDLQGAPSLVVRWPATDRSVERADVERALQESLAEASPAEHERIRQRYADRRVATAFPAHAQLVVDATGSLWVREYERPGHAGPARWMVFDLSGQLVGYVETPHRMRVLEVGTDYVLGVTFDDFDVEHVQIYDLARAGGAG